MSYDDWLTTPPPMESAPDMPAEPCDELIEAISDAIDALDFYAAPNCWGDPNVAAQTAAKLRDLLKNFAAEPPAKAPNPAPPAALKGIEATYVYLDEASAIDDIIWEVAEGVLSGEAVRDTLAKADGKPNPAPPADPPA